MEGSDLTLLLLDLRATYSGFVFPCPSGTDMIPLSSDPDRADLEPLLWMACWKPRIFPNFFTFFFLPLTGWPEDYIQIIRVNRIWNINSIKLCIQKIWTESLRSHAHLPQKASHTLKRKQSSFNILRPLDYYTITQSKPDEFDFW